jgi:hypothetical protein
MDPLISSYMRAETYVLNSNTFEATVVLDPKG